MKRSIRRTIATIVLMTVFAISLLWFYDYWSKRTDSPFDKSTEDLSEVEMLLEKDLELYYPKTPREVVKLFGNMLKTLYSDLNDEETEALARKVRELYDEEFLINNPEETYLINLYSELAEWKEEDRRITNFQLDDEEESVQSAINGKEYDVEYVYFTIHESAKYKEHWRILLRLDDNKKWRILGWEITSSEEIIKSED